DALDAVRPAVMHEARALDLHEGARAGARRHQLDDAREPRERRAGMRAAEARRVAGIDPVELARHREADVARSARGALEARVMDHEGHAVGRELDVELDVDDATAPGRLQSGKRVLGKMFRVASVCDDGRRHAGNYSRAATHRRLHRGGMQPAGTRPPRTRNTSTVTPAARTLPLPARASSPRARARPGRARNG